MGLFFFRILFKTSSIINYLLNLSTPVMVLISLGLGVMASAILVHLALSSTLLVFTSNTQACTDRKCRIICGDYPPCSDDITLDSSIVLSGIITIEGKLHHSKAPEGKTAHDYLQFLLEDDNEGKEPILEIVTQVGKSEENHAVYFRGGIAEEDSVVTWYPTSDSSQIEYMMHPNASAVGDFWVYPDTDVVLQISDMGSGAKRYYDVFAGKPGEASNFTFNYGSDENWKKFRDRRLGSTRKLKHKDDYGVLSISRITVCSGPRPDLLSESNFEMVNVRLGESYSLSCSAEGGFFLGSIWIDMNGTVIDGNEEVVYFEGASSLLHSTLKIDKLEEQDTGEYTCTIFNKNFRTASSVNKRVRLCIDCDGTTDPSFRFDLFSLLIGVAIGLVGTILFWHLLKCFKKKRDRIKSG